MAIEKQRSSQTDDELSSFVPPTFNSLGTPSLTREVITIDDGDEEETLEPKTKNQRLGSWWDYDDNINELSIVVKGIPKPEDAAASMVDSSFSSTNLHETMTKNKEEDYVEETLEPMKKQQRLGSWWDDDDNINELSIVVKGLSKLNDAAASIVDSSFSSTNLHETMTKNQEEGERSLSSCFHKNFPVDSCVSSSCNYLPETETNTNKDAERSLLSSSHHVANFIDFSKEEIVGESTNRGNRHVSLEEFGVSVEELKSVPWEAFDPTWEIRSETMDPWLGGYIKDMLSTYH